MVPRETTLAILDEELPPALAWAERIGWSASMLEGSLEMDLRLSHPRANTPLLLTADFSDYKAVPPAWTFRQPEDRLVSTARFPAAGSGPYGASIFHSTPAICAPFNRLAFKVNGGPHGNWGPPSNWLAIDDKVVATTIADMLQVIRMHLADSPGTQR